MSQQAVEMLIGRAVAEDEFRATLLSDPDAALAGHDLTGSESAALKAMDVEALVDYAGTLDQRISKSAAIGTMFEDGITVIRPGEPLPPVGQPLPTPPQFWLMRHLPVGA